MSLRRHNYRVDGKVGQTYHLNVGPQHPSTHGVLRVVLHLDGERILDAEPVIGYSHRAHEKMAENRTYMQWLPNPSRMDYVGGLIYNLGHCVAVERLMGLEEEIPRRAQVLRTILAEFNRISSHLLWFGTYLLDLGTFTPFLYAFQARERVLDLLDEVTGSRLTYCWGRFGGVIRDIPQGWEGRAQAVIDYVRQDMRRYQDLVEGNVIFRQRVDGVGVIDRALCRRFGITGPNARACGIARDLRKDEPYHAYDQFTFDIPTRSSGDCLARYEIRLDEIEQSCRIIEQAIDALEDGPILMDKKLSNKFKAPAGSSWTCVEAARGTFGLYLVADGTDTPYRVKARVPSFSALSALPAILPGTMIADTIAILGSIDVVMPEVDR